MKADMEMVAHGWASIEETQRRKHYNTIRICLFSPFLFGKSYVSSNWLEWMQSAGFLKSAKRLEIKCYEDDYFFAMDILDKTFESLHNMMEKPIFFYSCMSVVEEIDSIAKKPEDCIRIGKAESTFCDFFNDEGDSFEKKMALLYCAKSYIEYVYYVVKLGKCRFKEIAAPAHLQKRIQTYKSKGNSKFQEGSYSKAILLYSKALQLDPFNHYLYGNRAQTYLKTDKFLDALWDSRRALILEPHWAKGCYRYAQAFFELNFLERALHENYQGFQFADEPTENRDLSNQMEKFYAFKNGYGNKRKQDDDDDVPDLVEQVGSSEESASDDSSDPECMPDLVSDGLESFSDDASDSEFIEPTHARLIEIRRKRLLRERKGIEERIKRVEKKKQKQKQKVKRESPIVITQIPSRPPFKQEVTLKIELKRRRPQDTTITPIPLIPSIHINPIPKQINPTPKQTKPIPKQMKPSRKQIKSTPKQCPKPNHVEMMKELTIGSRSHLDDKEREALTQYHKVIKFMRDSSDKYGGMSEDDYVGFTYCYAHICLNSGIPDEIQKSEQLFRGILKDHASIFFPLAYYGIGCYYKRLNRFPEAVVQLKKGEKSLNESPESQPVISWPGTKETVKESVSENILELFEELLHDCKNPPKPLALCSINHCTYIKRDIYLTDMDFKGYVHFVCTEDCRLDYHIGCWKSWKVEFYHRTHEKDILNKACSTPDCLGIICTIQTYGNDGLVRSEAKADAICKSKKTAQPSQSVLSKSKKKRQKKKQKKLSEEEEPVVPNIEVTSENTESHTKPKDNKPKKETPTTPEVDEEKKLEKKEEDKSNEKEEEENIKEEILEKQVNYEFVLKKDDIEDIQPTKSAKKKKQKSKKALSDFQIKFTGDEDRRFWGHEDADENGFIEYKKYMTPLVNREAGVYPAELGPPPGDLKAYEKFAENMDEIVYMLYSYFHAILEKEGPLPITSDLILDDFKTFPFEAHLIVEAAGGVAPFLLKSLKFAMFEDHICLLKHAVRCKEILARKHGHLMDSDLKPSKPHKQSPEHHPKDFQPLLTPFALSPLCQNLKKNVVKRSFNGLDGVEDIQINDNGSDEDKELSDVYSTASETDHNGVLDQDDGSISTTTTTEESEIDGSQESNLASVGSSPKKTFIDDFQGDEEYIDDDILGKELELERYMMEVSSVDGPSPNNYVAKDIAVIADSPDVLSVGSSEPAPVPSTVTQKSVNDSGIGTFSPDDLVSSSVDPSLKPEEVETKFQHSKEKVILPPEIIEGFCLNKPTPYSEIKPKIREPSSESLTEKYRAAQEKLWVQALDIYTSLNEHFDWFTVKAPPRFDPYATTEEIGHIMLIPSCLWEMAVGSIAKIRDHCMEIQKKKSHMKSKFVQCIPKTKNVCLITTPYEPFKQEYLEMKTANNQMRESLKDTITKYVHLENSNVVEVTRLKDEIKEIQLQNEELSKQLNEKATLVEQQQKLQTELAYYVTEGKAKDERLQTQEDLLVQIKTETTKLAQKMKHVQQERDKHLTEQNKMKEAIESTSRSSQDLKSRAEQSEIKLLTLMCRNQSKTLMDVIKEAERNRDKLVNSDQGDLIDAAIQTWMATVTINTKKVRELKNNYDVLIQKVMSGTPLDSLPPVDDVLPYWPPPKSVQPTKKPAPSGSAQTVSAPSGSDVSQAIVSQVLHNTAAPATSAPSNPADQQQQNSWLSAQQNEAKRREVLHQANMNHGQNPQWQQQQQQMHSSQSNVPLRMVGRQLHQHAYSNGNGRPAVNPNGGNGRPAVNPNGGNGRPAVNPNGMAHGGPQGVPHVGPQGVSHVGPQGMAQGGPQGMQHVGPQGMAQGGPQGLQHVGPQGMAQGGPQGVPPVGISSNSGAGYHSVPQQPTPSNPPQAVAFASSSKPSQASPVKQANSSGAVGGSKVSGRVIPPAPAHLKNSFDKLIYQLGEMFNHQYTKGQLAMFLKEVRAANGGSLSGLPSKDIIDRVVKMVLKREEEHPVNHPAKASYPKKIPPGMNVTRDSGLSTWKTMPSKLAKTLNLEEEDPCVICHEEMPMKPVSKLECQHIFHTDCIQRWMNEQKTCPTCREFVLLPADYPSL